MSEHETSATDPELARLASINLNLLVPLLALLEERSVTRAASRVGLSQPAMSHALRRMRRLLGDELLVRRGNDTTLTPRGAELVVPLRQALHRTAHLVDPPSFDPAVDHRVITVTMTTSKALVLGSTLARLVARRAPNATLRLRTATAVSEDTFTDEGSDVLLLSDTTASPHPREHLYDDRWVVIAGPDAPAEASATDLLTSLPHVVFDAAQRIFPYDVLDEHRLAYTVRDRVSDYLLIPHVVAGSGGVALHRLRAASALRDSLGLRIEEFPFPVRPIGIDMIWNPWLVDESFRSWLRGILVETAGSLGLRSPETA
ncbi:LysR family transcriptional regulator [Saccharomonospora iraqiensis]|uniref:LysR family transcriptional regulator n=1 Tax=Saccharomonospora iraqiensis TaxID=52698 RepID=UPI00047DEF9D|nr:LysR family transcriptional regulator [Saccharomonospora iraqiensis]